MNVFFISLCEKNALAETRRILDTFASRNGDKAWRTSITSNGLETVRKLLRASSRKNTAVGCYKIGSGGSESGFELMWTVGGKGRFACDGSTPTNTTSRDILRTKDERQIKGQRWMGLLVDLASLFHDLGKATVAFQSKLRHSAGGILLEKNQYRHEWISLRLFAAFVNSRSDKAWLDDLCTFDSSSIERAWLVNYKPLEKPSDDVNDAHKYPFKSMGDLARAVGWLILSHHRLPQAPFDQKNTISFSSLTNWASLIDVDWNENVHDRIEDVSNYWRLKGKLPFSEPMWCKRVKRVATGMSKEMEREQGITSLCKDAYVMHLARLCLMWSDHHYSSLSRIRRSATSAPSEHSTHSTHSTPDPRRLKIQTDSDVYANTQAGSLNQTLVEHLLGVAMKGAEIARALPDLNRILPGLGSVKALKKRSGAGRFEWQDKAVDAAFKIAKSSDSRGGFVVNIASTGVGKTIANARMVDALNAHRPGGMRATFALGLRTLTMQTGKEFRSTFGLNDEQVAVRVGGQSSQKLSAWLESQAESQGSASAAPLEDVDGFVDGDTDIDEHRTFSSLLGDPKIKALIAAPILVCTVDHLVPATESKRGGKQIAPMLRLMTSDLVLDEPDDFDISDLPALARLVYSAGLLGARIIISSATLTPDLLVGLYDAYQSGRKQFNAQHGHTDSQMKDGEDGEDGELGINCLWVDEHGCESVVCSTREDFSSAHQKFASQRFQRLSEQTHLRRRNCELSAIGFKNNESDTRNVIDRAANDITQSVFMLHGLNAHELQGKKISFGLIRLANIGVIQDLAPVLASSAWPEGVQVHLCVYHSRFPQIIRAGIEEKLDRILKWKEKTPLDQPEVTAAIARYPLASHHIFIVLGSPVTEVGRDHDYDWAICEPSSMRSLIQILGRVRRHRPAAYHTLNVLIMRMNFKALKDRKKPCFSKPGFELEEGSGFFLDEHDLLKLMDASELKCLDSRSRLLTQAQSGTRNRLASLEHDRMAKAFSHQSLSVQSSRHKPSIIRENKPSAWWSHANDDATFTSTIVDAFPFRKTEGAESELLLHIDDSGDVEIQEIKEYDRKKLEKVGKRSKFGPRKLSLATSLKSQQIKIPDDCIKGVQLSPWFSLDYLAMIEKISKEMDMDTDDAIMLFGQVKMMGLKPTDRLYFNEALGMGKLTKNTE